MLNEKSERDLFVVFLKTKGILKIDWNCMGVITNMVREAGCALGYNDIELMQEVWMEKAKAQAVPVWVSTEFMLPDEGDLVLFLDSHNVIHEGTLNTDYVDGPYGENGEDLGDNETLWTSNSNGEEFLLKKVKYWMHRPSGPRASESGEGE
jgi:hypothetical protein